MRFGHGGWNNGCMPSIGVAAVRGPTETLLDGGMADERLPGLTTVAIFDGERSVATSHTRCGSFSGRRP